MSSAWRSSSPPTRWTRRITVSTQVPYIVVLGGVRVGGAPSLTSASTCTDWICVSLKASAMLGKSQKFDIASYGVLWDFTGFALRRGVRSLMRGRQMRWEYRTFCTRFVDVVGRAMVCGKISGAILAEGVGAGRGRCAPRRAGCQHEPPPTITCHIKC